MAELSDTARVTPADVLDLISTNLGTPKINKAINIASKVVDNVLAGEPLVADLLADIEALLAAHFIAIQDPLTRSESHGGTASATFQVPQAGTGYEATSYGQQALALDLSGALAQTGSAKKASFGVINRE